MNGLTASLLVAALVSVVFLVQGLFNADSGQSQDRFFLLDRRLSADDFGWSFAAASTSLASVLIFFVTFGSQHGLYVLVAPLSLWGGVWLYRDRVLPRLAEQGFFESKDGGGDPLERVSLGTTLVQYILDRFESRSVSLSIGFMTAVGLVAILLIELFVGIQIFSIFVVEGAQDWALVVIGVVLLIYSGVGGFPAVVRTDRYQFWLMLLGVLVFVAWCVFRTVSMPSQNPDTSIAALLFPHSISFDGGFLLPWTLLANMVVVNLLLITAVLRTWEMTASSPNPHAASKGLLEGLLWTVLISVSLLVAGILFYGVIAPTTSPVLPELLTSLANMGGLAAGLVLPLLFAASLAALFSTADSSLLPLLQSYWTDIRESPGRTWRHREIVLVDAALILFAFLLHYVVFHLLNFNLITWLFTIFSFLIVAAPVILFTVWAPKKILCNDFTRAVAVVALWGGLAISIGLSIYGNKQGMLWLVQLNSPAAVVFESTLLLGVTLWHNRGRHRKERLQ